MKRNAPLSVLLDEGAPVLIGEPFAKRGHRVIYHGDVLASGAKDTQVCATAILNNAALIAVDRDMKQLAKRFGNAEKGGRYGAMNLIFFNCNGVIAPKRAEHLRARLENRFGGIPAWV